MRKLPILNYHGIESRPREYEWTPEERVYVLNRGEFARHLDYAVSAGYTALLPKDLDAWAAGMGDIDRPVMLTFDDGHASHYDHAAPMLEEHGMKGLFFVSAGWIGKNGYMDAARIRELAAAGFEIGSHGYNHVPLSRLNDAELRHEIHDSRKAIEDVCGRAVNSFSVPRGFYNRRVHNEVDRADYDFLFTSHFGLNPRRFNPMYLKRMAPTHATGLREFGSWISGGIGWRQITEEFKERGRQLLGPGIYGTLARVKARLLHT